MSVRDQSRAWIALIVLLLFAIIIADASSPAPSGQEKYPKSKSIQKMQLSHTLSDKSLPGGDNSDEAVESSSSSSKPGLFASAKKSFVKKEKKKDNTDNASDSEEGVMKKSSSGTSTLSVLSESKQPAKMSESSSSHKSSSSWKLFNPFKRILGTKKESVQDNALAVPERRAPSKVAQERRLSMLAGQLPTLSSSDGMEENQRMRTTSFSFTSRHFAEECRILKQNSPYYRLHEDNLIWRGRYGDVYTSFVKVNGLNPPERPVAVKCMKDQDLFQRELYHVRVNPSIL